VESKPKAKDTTLVALPVLVAAVVALAGATGAYFYYQQARDRRPDTPILTAEAADYLPHLKLDDVEMKAAESYLRQTVTTISGKITNRGPRTLRLVEIHCVFRNPYGQIVLRERVSIIGRKTGPAPSGQTKTFELTFDNIPESWNQAMPDLVISQIQFEN
jgi:hypothetical protein